MNHPDDPARDFELLGVSSGSGSLWPLSVTVHLTERCNHSCSWCWFTRSSAEIEISAVIESLTKFVAMGAREIIVSGGGEPLLHPDMGGLLRYLSALPAVHRRLYTNGSLLHKHNLVENAFDYVRVSLDAGGSELYSKLHGTGKQAYTKILSNLSEMAARKTGLLVGVSMVASTFNAYSRDLLINDCHSFNIPYILVKPLIVGHQRETIHSVPESALLPQVLTRSASPLPRLGLSSPPEEFVAKCLTIAPNSRVYPCCHLSDRKFLIAEVSKVAMCIGSKEHRDSLGNYAAAVHPCRLHDLWMSSPALPEVTPL